MTLLSLLGFVGPGVSRRGQAERGREQSGGVYSNLPLSGHFPCVTLNVPKPTGNHRTCTVRVPLSPAIYGHGFLFWVCVYVLDSCLFACDSLGESFTSMDWDLFEARGWTRCSV